MKFCIPLLILGALLSTSCVPRSYVSQAQSANGPVVAKFPSQNGGNTGFFFGLATAPAHVEDKLNDGWADFADAGNVSSFKNQPIPHERLRFWTDYKTEIDLVASTGAKVFRMGIDWGRLVPNKPDFASCAVTGGVQDRAALNHYIEIVDYARSKNLDIMLTLFHHSAPKWLIQSGGWPVNGTRDCFVRFSKDIVDALGSKVAYWLTFNEPSVFNVFTYVAGMWPPGGVTQNPAEMFAVPGFFRGKLIAANENMAAAHEAIYKYIHETKKLSTPVGIAHNVGWYKANSALDVPSAALSGFLFNDLFLDLISHSMDFIGVNYYGAEYVSGTSIAYAPGVEYSDSGRAVDPYGLYALLKDLNDRYNVWFVNRKSTKKIPFIITENGISDANDLMRPAYMIEHHMAVHKARQEGIDVLGYVFWTISDNWEWKDGYCPKFGLFEVDRANNLKRKPRDYSLNLFKEIVQTGAITQQQRSAAWNRYTAAQNSTSEFTRPMCRAADGQSALEIAIPTPYRESEWRFDENRRSRRFDVVDPLALHETAQDIVRLVGPKIPYWLREDTERRKLIGSFFSMFDAFRGSKFSISAAPGGRLKLGIHSAPGTRIACDVSKQISPATLVFEDSVYLSLPQPPQLDKTVIAVEGLRLFAGPRVTSNFNFRVPIEKVALEGTVISFHSSAAPLLLRVATADFLAPPPPPEIRCEKVPLSQFGDGISGH